MEKEKVIKIDELFNLFKDGWFCYRANFDDQEPYVIIANNKVLNDERKVLIPEQIAYYLRTHFCGSEIMHKEIEKNTRMSIAYDLRKIIGIEKFDGNRI